MRKMKRDENDTLIDRVFSPLKKLLGFFGDKIYSAQVALRRKFPRRKAVSIGVKRRNESIFYYLMLAFPILQFLVFYVGVNLNSVLLSFKEYRVGTGEVGYIWTGLSNYKQFFRDFFQGDALKQIGVNSLIVYACTLLIGVPLAILFSFYLYKRFPLTNLFKVLLFLPSIISSVIMVLMYKYFVDRGLPAIVERLFHIKMAPPLSASGTRFFYVLFYNLFICYGTSVIMYTSSMTRVPPSLIEYARLEGAGVFQRAVQHRSALDFPHDHDLSRRRRGGDIHQSGKRVHILRDGRAARRTDFRLFPVRAGDRGADDDGGIPVCVGGGHHLYVHRCAAHDGGEISAGKIRPEQRILKGGRRS